MVKTAIVLWGLGLLKKKVGQRSLSFSVQISAMKRIRKLGGTLRDENRRRPGSTPRQSVLYRVLTKRTSQNQRNLGAITPRFSIDSTLDVKIPQMGGFRKELMNLSGFVVFRGVSRVVHRFGIGVKSNEN